MKNVFRHVFFWGALLCVFLCSGALAEPEKPVALYFFENYCESCHPEQDFKREFRELTGQPLEAYRYQYENVATAKGRERYAQAVEQHQIPKEEQRLPMLIVDGRVFAGSAGIRQALPKVFIENGAPTASTVYYLYSPACESCVRAKTMLSALGDSVEVSRGEHRFLSELNILEINIFEDPGAAQALFERYAVPENRRITPMLLMRDQYFAGESEIGVALDHYLPRGAAIGTALLAPDEAGTTADMISWTATAVAGITAGFNPCALSMLLLFLALLLGAGVSAARYAALFLASKFGSYLLIGTLLLRAFQAFNPTWMPLAVRIVLSAACLALAAMNLMDARAARQQRYGDVKNQLPTRMRRFLHGRIKRALASPGPGLALAVAALGFVVAGGEFMCAGQLYLAALTSGIQAGVESARMFAMLALFCALFILPSAVLAALAVRGRAVFELGEWARGRMPLIKLITAAALLLVCIVSWLPYV